MGNAVTLVGLALVDSLSIGTLVVPVVLIVLMGRVDVRRLGTYLATVVITYFVLGVGLLYFLETIRGAAASMGESDVVSWSMVVIGALLLVYGVLAPSPKKANGATTARIRRRLAGGGQMVGLGLAAAVAEVATMLPYLGAMTIIGTWDAPWAGQIMAVAGYCLVMVLPALVLIGLAAAVGGPLISRIERVAPSLKRQARSTVLWVAAIAGVLLIRMGWQALAG